MSTNQPPCFSDLPWEGPRVLPCPQGSTLDLGEGRAVCLSLGPERLPPGFQAVAGRVSLRFGEADLLGPTQEALARLTRRCQDFSLLGGEAGFDDAYAASPLTALFTLGLGRAEAEPGFEPAAILRPEAPPEPPPAPLALPPDLEPDEVEAAFRQLLASPTLAGKRMLFQPGLGTEQGDPLPGLAEGDAGLVQVPGTAMALALATAGSGRFAHLDPFWGAAHAAAEACRDLACVGAEPLGLAGCLQVTPERVWVLEQMVLGLRQACLAFEVPVVACDAPEGRAGFPTPLVAAVGLLEDVAPPVDVTASEAKGLIASANHCSGSGFRAAHDAVFLLGDTRQELGGSEYLKLRTGGIGGECPELRLDEEFRLQACVREGVRMGLLRSAHGTGEGGLLAAVLDSALSGGLGCQLMLFRRGLRFDSLCFGETAGRVVVSLSPEGESSLARLCATHRVAFAKIGTTGGPRFTVAVDGHPLLDAELDELRELRPGPPIPD